MTLSTGTPGSDGKNITHSDPLDILRTVFKDSIFKVAYITDFRLSVRAPLCTSLFLHFHDTDDSHYSLAELLFRIIIASASPPVPWVVPGFFAFALANRAVSSISCCFILFFHFLSRARQPHQIQHDNTVTPMRGTPITRK